MAMELEKTNSGALAIAKRSFRESQDRELAVMLDAMANQYRLSLALEDIKLWRLILIERARLSGAQIREGFLAYLAGPRAAFPPQPGEIIALVSNQPPERENQTLREIRELRKRAASGEQFFGEADLWKYAAEHLGLGRTRVAKPMPAAEPAPTEIASCGNSKAVGKRTSWPEIDLERNAEKLAQQRRQLLSQAGIPCGPKGA